MSQEKEKTVVPSVKKKRGIDKGTYSGLAIKEAPKKTGAKNSHKHRANSRAGLGPCKKPLTAEELERFLYNVVLGKVKDRFGFDASLEDRFKAAQKLLDRKDKQNVAAEDEKKASDANTKILEALQDITLGPGDK